MAIKKACIKATAAIKALEKNGVELDDKEKAAIVGAFGVRGRYAGYLTKNKPNGNKKPLEAAAWLAMQPNAYKTSMSALMFLFDKERELYDKLTKLPNGELINYPANFDLDMEQLKNMGVW